MKVTTAIPSLVSDQEGAAAGSPVLPSATAPVRPCTPGNQVRNCRIVVVHFFPLLVHVEVHPCCRKPFPGLDAHGHESGAWAGGG